jgi:thiol-disulfide isomerase/thioredoxin
MRSRLVIVSVVAVGLIGGITFYLMNKPVAKEEAGTRLEQTVPPKENMQGEVAKAGSYETYEPASIAATKGIKILFFYAPWCPQCRKLEADIKSQTIPGGVTIYKVDYDSNQTLRQKYGVTIQTTLVRVDDEGNLVKKYVAYDEPSLESVKVNLIQ